MEERGDREGEGEERRCIAAAAAAAERWRRTGDVREEKNCPWDDGLRRLRPMMAFGPVIEPAQGQPVKYLDFGLINADASPSSSQFLGEPHVPTSKP